MLTHPTFKAGRTVRTAGCKIQTQMICAKTGRILKTSPWVANLLFDSGLATMANGSGFANIMANCKVGSSAAPNYTHNPAITFTQAGTTITASGGIFTAGMVGQLFKYGTGTGGAEYYITGYSSATSITVDTSDTVASPAAGTIWNVSQTTLQGYLYINSAVTGGSTVVVNTNTYQLTRVFTIPAKMSGYTVNEIGYCQNSANNSTVDGRVVLPTSDNVGASTIYSVTIVLTYSTAPTAATQHYANTASNFNNAGTGIFRNWACQGINTSGATVPYCPGISGGGYANGIMDSSENCAFQLILTSFTLPSAISNGNNSIVSGGYQIGPGNFMQSGKPWFSIAQGTFSFTTAGETCYGFIFGTNSSGIAVTQDFFYLFDNPQTLPTGTFAGNWLWFNSFGRILTNP